MSTADTCVTNLYSLQDFTSQANISNYFSVDDAEQLWGKPDLFKQYSQQPNFDINGVAFNVLLF